MNHPATEVTYALTRQRLNSTPSVMHRLLPNEPRVVNAKAQAHLTQRYLLPYIKVLTAYWLALRAQVDLPLRQANPIKLGKPYPIGQCLEITLAVQQLLRTNDTRFIPGTEEEQGQSAFSAFRKAGGTVRQVWGDLRGEFFQNAFQVGTLYVDVANDTVTPSKPKIEIQSFIEANFVPIRDFHHFAHLAAHYWQVRVYPNHVVPALAPTCPLILLSPSGQFRLAEATHYMVALAQATAYRMSEAVLYDEPMPTEVFAKVSERLTGTRWQLPSNPTVGRAAALRACREQRAKRWHRSQRQAHDSIKTALEINHRLGKSLTPTNSIPLKRVEPTPSELTGHTQAIMADLRATEQAIAALTQRLAIYQTARHAYAHALHNELAKIEIG